MRSTNGQKLILVGLVFGVWGFGFYMGSAYYPPDEVHVAPVDTFHAMNPPQPLPVGKVASRGSASQTTDLIAPRAARKSHMRTSDGDGGVKMPHHGTVDKFIHDVATPEQMSLLKKLVDHLSDSGMPYVKLMLESHPDELECSLEHGYCQTNAKCFDGESYKISYGSKKTKLIERIFKESEMPASCNTPNFGSSDPAPGENKKCFMKCTKQPVKVNRVSQCNAQSEVREWALIPGCVPAAASAPKEEQILQGAIGGFCANPMRKPGMDAWVDCKYRDAFGAAVGNPQWSGRPTEKEWIDRAWVTFFAGPSTGMKHSMMVTNLIRSIHFFSKYPILVYVVGTPELSQDWDPKVFPNLIIVHADGLETMNGGVGGISFNFNKFRSMMLRIKVAVQLDADMVVGAHCDRLFDSTAAEITAEYPYPIMPVHWMSRYKEKGKQIDGFGVYAVDYPKGWPERIRWAHCHPTWTYHALPFIADALWNKLDYTTWSTSPRVTAALGPNPPQNPPEYMAEDEDILNILLWRYRAQKLWCKWDVEPDIFEKYLMQQTAGQETMVDGRWFQEGVPLVIVTMHNTKHTAVIDTLLGKLAREGFPDKYLFWKGKYYSDPAALRADQDTSKAPCILI